MDTSNQPINDQKGGLSIKSDCPHEQTLNYESISSLITKDILSAPCADCDNTKENWICLECHKLGCLGSGESYILKHHQATKHHIALDLTKGYPWCYTCDSYIHSKKLVNLVTLLSCVINSAEDINPTDVDRLSQIFKILKLNLQEEEEDPFTRTKLIDGLKNHSFKKVVLLTGAGISVSAGIPDFRSPKTGLYANLETYNLPYPEAVFDIKYFKDHPEPFYRLTKELFKDTPKPTISHYFIKALLQEGLLYLNFTQNIDGLEVAAGICVDYLIEAHGNYREAHCIDCGANAPIKRFFEHVEKQEIYKCDCSGLVKPDIVFFGESLPTEFFLNAEKLDEADLVVVMGTSLKVFPFAALLQLVRKEVPVVYINRENTSITRQNFLFMEGDIDEQVKQLVKDLEWEDRLAKAQELK